MQTRVQWGIGSITSSRIRIQEAIHQFNYPFNRNKSNSKSYFIKSISEKIENVRVEKNKVRESRKSGLSL
jgi:hypothetical protein